MGLKSVEYAVQFIVVISSLLRSSAIARVRCGLALSFVKTKSVSLAPRNQTCAGKDDLLRIEISSNSTSAENLKLNPSVHRNASADIPETQ
ncbi:hypothetical protein AVEN_236896-1 [Araneus ventricosus]|uniref:Uncharacterized protein n=1 Tax=Araneus ventricosus TaxID=182803 RepID=A0A4Y2DS15_ARAVE|nr:hypothetical protein AVEN_236896-1 [Araneus ventricosus]